MKTFLSVLLLVCAASASAFDSTAWFANREIMMREAERLRAAYAACTNKLTETAEGVAIPVETYDNGAIKMKLEAKKAQFFMKEGLVWAADVVIRKLDEAGAELSRIEAAACIVDRTTKSGWIEGAAKIHHDKTEFDGANVYFSSPEGYVMTFGGASLVTTDLKFGGAL